MAEVTKRQIDLARAAIEAFWLAKVQSTAQWCLRNRQALTMFPPNGQEMFEGAKALADRERSVTDWGDPESNLALAGDD